MTTSKTVLRKALSLDLSTKNFDAQNGVVEGYAAVFGNIDQHGDVIEKGAFKHTLSQRGDKIAFLWQHDKREVAGKIVELKEDDIGLYFKAVFSGIGRGPEVRELLKLKALGGFSIGFQIIKQEPSQYNGRSITRIKEIRLLEVSAVTFPCNEEATLLSIKDEFTSVLDQLHEDDVELVTKYAEFLTAQREAIEPANDDELETKSEDEAQVVPVDEAPESVNDDEVQFKQLREQLELEALAMTLRRAMRR